MLLSILRASVKIVGTATDKEPEQSQNIYLVSKNLYKIAVHLLCICVNTAASDLSLQYLNTESLLAASHNKLTNLLHLMRTTRSLSSVQAHVSETLFTP
jgi:hypothetical protein